MTIHYTHRIKENRKTLIVYRSSWSFRDCRDFDLVRRRRWRSVVAANLWAGRDSPVSVELLLTKPSSYSYSSLTNKSKLIVRIGKTLAFMTTKRRPFSPFPRVFHTHTPRTYTHTHTHTILQQWPICPIRQWSGVVTHTNEIVGKEFLCTWK